MSRDCLICERETENTVDACCHRICWDCLERHCRTQISDGVHGIECPALRCRKTLPYNYVVRCLDNNELYVHRLDVLITNAALEDELQSTNRRCPQCRSICDLDEKRFFCAGCTKFYCAACNEEEHENDADCAFQQIAEVVVDNDYKRCPKCRIFITKFDGCDCVRCPHCKRKFCWNCLMVLKHMESVEQHNETCENFSAFNENEQSDAESE